jgi:hypothetical protein
MVVEITETYRKLVELVDLVVVELLSDQAQADLVHKVLTVAQVVELAPTAVAVVELVKLVTLTAMALVAMEALLTPLGVQQQALVKT